MWGENGPYTVISVVSYASAAKVAKCIPSVLLADNKSIYVQMKDQRKVIACLNLVFSGTTIQIIVTKAEEIKISLITQFHKLFNNFRFIPTWHLVNACS